MEDKQLMVELDRPVYEELEFALEEYGHKKISEDHANGHLSFLPINTEHIADLNHQLLLRALKEGFTVRPKRITEDLYHAIRYVCSFMTVEEIMKGCIYGFNSEKTHILNHIDKKSIMDCVYDGYIVDEHLGSMRIV